MRLVFTVFCLNLFFAVSAQRPNIKVSDAYKYSRQHLFGKHLLSDSTGHYACFYDYHIGGDAWHPNEILLEKYDQDLRFVYSKSFETRKNEKHVGIFWFNGNFLWFKQVLENQDHTLWMTPIDRDGKMGTPVAYSKNSAENPAFAISLQRGYWQRSPDSSKLLFSTGYLDGEMNLMVFNENYEMLWTISSILPESYAETFLIDAIVDNDGSATLLSSFPYVAGMLPLISRFDAKGIALKDFVIDLKTMAIDNIRMTRRDNEVLRFVGLFSDTLNRGNRGIYCFDMDTSGRIGQVNQKRLTTKQMSQMCEPSNIGKNKKIMGTCTFNAGPLYTDKDGYLYYLAQEYYRLLEIHSRGGGGSTHLNEVLWSKIDPKGKIETISLLPKRQAANISTHLSYAFLQRDREPAIIYNEHVKNLSKPVEHDDPDTLGDYIADCVPVITSMDEEGAFKREMLILGQGYSGTLIPRWSKQIGPNTVFFVLFETRAIGKDRVRMGLMTFD
jgi:hypothetical protein